MAENQETDNPLAKEEDTVVGKPEQADTLVDFLPIDKQSISDHEAEQLKRLINQRSPYRAADK